MPVQCINFPFGFIFLFHTFGAFSKLFIDIYVFYTVKLSIFITFLSVEMWKLSHLTEFNNSFSRFRIRLLIERVLGRVVCGCRVPIIQPFAIKLVTTKKERAMHMPYNPKHVSKALRICFPIMVTIIAGFIAPMSVSLVGFLMLGNLLRECSCLERLSQTAQNDLANLITLLLGITISFSMAGH